MGPAGRHLHGVDLPASFTGRVEMHGTIRGTAGNITCIDKNETTGELILRSGSTFIATGTGVSIDATVAATDVQVHGHVVANANVNSNVVIRGGVLTFDTVNVT